MKYIMFLLLLTLTACSAPLALLDTVPPVEFEFFRYHRAGNATSADITATNSKKLPDGSIEIESLTITADYGPFVNFNIDLEGYKRSPIEE